LAQVLSCQLKFDHEIVEYLLKMASLTSVWGLWLSGRQADRQKGRKAERQEGWQEGHASKQACKQAGKKADRKVGK
jgi:hypothetical protein